MDGAWKVGGLVLGFVALLVGAYATLGRSLFAEKTASYSAVFADAGGVTEGSPVLLSGVRVGQVAKVSLTADSQAELQLAIVEGTTIPQGTEAILATSLVGIGDRPVQLVPPAQPSGSLPPGSKIVGRIKGPLEGMFPDTTETMSELTATLKATRELISDQGMKQRVETLMDSTNTTITQFGALAARMDGMIGENQGTLRQTLLQASKIMTDVSTTSAQIAKIATSGKLEGKTYALLDEMTASVKESQALIGDLRATINDPQMKESMNAILSNTEKMTDSGTRIASNAEVMSKNGITLTESANEIAAKASKLVDELSELLKKVDGAVGSFAGAGAASNLRSEGAEMRFIRETDPGRFRAEAEFGFGIGKDVYHIGVWDAFESNKLIAQTGTKFSDQLELRYGVYASQLGLGVHYQIAPGFKIRGDVFDVNEPRFDLRAGIRVSKDANVWLGLDRVFSRTSPTIGFGIRR